MSVAGEAYFNIEPGLDAVQVHPEDFHQNESLGDNVYRLRFALDSHGLPTFSLVWDGDGFQDLMQQAELAWLRENNRDGYRDMCVELSHERG